MNDGGVAGHPNVMEKIVATPKTRALGANSANKERPDSDVSQARPMWNGR